MQFKIDKLGLYCVAFLMLMFVQCVSKKKYNKTSLSYQKQLTQLKKDSVFVHTQLERIRQDSIAMKARLDELVAFKEKTESKTVSTSRSVKPKTISENKEYEDKATFIYNIAKYIDWPASAKAENFKIGILGNSKIETAIKTKLASKKNGAEKFIIDVFATVKDISPCHILIISRGNPNTISVVKNKLGKSTTLIITEEDYMKAGSHINLRVDGNEVKMSLNKEAIKAAEMKISKNLISLSEE